MRAPYTSRVGDHAKTDALTVVKRTSPARGSCPDTAGRASLASVLSMDERDPPRAGEVCTWIGAYRAGLNADRLARLLGDHLS